MGNNDSSALGAPKSSISTMGSAVGPEPQTMWPGDHVMLVLFRYLNNAYIAILVYV